jgi:choline dehydrogenase-like flavoprotein
MSTSPYLDHSPDRRDWDVVVIGAGLGGAVVGSRLAQAGRSVLFLEKGHFLHDPAKIPTDGSPHPASTRFGGDTAELQLRGGRWPAPLTGDTSFGQLRFHAPLGCGTGGSSTLYAAQMERLSPIDFAPRQHHAKADGTTLPEQWPITYEEMRPFYEQAENLFSVCGTADPLERQPRSLPAPPPLSARDQQLFALLESTGLHPYRAHVGCKFVPDCQNCGGHFCAKMCKQDAGWACLLPTLMHHDARLVADCDVFHIEAEAHKVQRVWARHQGKELAIRAKLVILAAGALMSPLLLLRSKSAAWPNGLANTNGLVGRNLMLHTSDMVALKPDGAPATAGPQKSIALNDFYLVDGHKLGTFQTMGVAVDPWHIYNYLRAQEQRTPAWWRPMLRPLLRPASRIAGAYYRYSAVFATIVEDLPYADNRVIPDDTTPSGMRFFYTYRKELAERNHIYRRLLRQRLGWRRIAFLSGANNLNYGHACGTCRFGERPEDSVLDRNNRVHGIDNLHVVDASFMPSSGGTNPSLTIAANALRVAQRILAV